MSEKPTLRAELTDSSVRVLGLFHTCVKAAFIYFGGHINTEFTPAAEAEQCCVAETEV